MAAARSVLVAFCGLNLLLSTLHAQDQVKHRLAFPTEGEIKDNGVPVVKRYLELLAENRAKPLENNAEMWSLISQEYLASQEVSKERFILDFLKPEEFQVTGLKNGYVVAEVTNKSNNWTRTITFRILKEDDKFVIEPSAVNRRDPGERGKSSVTPWWTIGDIRKVKE